MTHDDKGPFDKHVPSDDPIYDPSDGPTGKKKPDKPPHQPGPFPKIDPKMI